MRLLSTIAAIMLCGTNAMAEQCGSEYLGRLRSAIEGAGGQISTYESFALGATIYPANSQIQSIKAVGWSIKGCRVPSVDVYVKGDDPSLGAVRGITAVVAEMFSPIAKPEDIASDQIINLMTKCLKGRSIKYSKDFRRTGNEASNKSILLMTCYTEASASGEARTYFRFMPAHID